MATKKKTYDFTKIIVFMLAGVIINITGKYIAICFSIPLWMDSAGTASIACILGPVYGAFCGGLSNIIYGLWDHVSYMYSLTSVGVGLIIGFSCKKGYFKSLPRAMSVGGIMVIAATALSAPVNLIFYQGTTGNLWGDGLYEMVRSFGINKMIASILGELFIDFPDKVIMILITYYIIKTPRNYMHDKWKKKVQSGAAFLLVLIVVSAGMSQVTAFASDLEMGEEQENTQSNFYTQTIYDSDDGLTAGEANAIVDTMDGYIWIGTYAGLYRYDGRKFTLMNFDSVKNVNRLFVDKKGRLWIGTNDNGVSIYENGTIIHVFDKKNGLPSNSVRCIGEDNNGNYFIGTSSMLCIISEEGDLKIEKTIPEIMYANSISVNAAGKTAIVTNAGDLYLLQNDKITGQYRLAVEGEDYTSCTFNFYGTLYVATTSNVIYPWDFTKDRPDMQKAIKTGNLSYIHSMYETEHGVIWICTDTGIGYFRNDKCVTVSTDSFNSSIDSMLKDYQGNLWFSSSRLGVLKLSKNCFKDIYNQCNLSHKVVNSVLLWNGMLYSGTDSGLDILDIKKKKLINNELSEMLKNNRIRCLYRDSKNNLWISTTAGVGLIQVLPNGEIITYGTKEGTIGERFRSTFELSDGTIIEAENTGIDFIKDGNVIATLGEKDGLTNPQILSFAEKDASTLYAGSDGDGIMIIRDHQVVGKITEEDGLPSGVILRMVKVDQGFVIVTSNSLCYMDQNQKIRELKEFPYSNNYDVISSDRGKLWILSSAGIYIVDKNDLLSGKPFKYELLDSKKGLYASLIANSWNYVDDDTLYFCSNSGVYSIDMCNYNIYSAFYRIMVNYVDTDNVSHVMKGVKDNFIPIESTRITIRPELLNYTLNDPYVSYYLEGVDDQAYTVQQSSLDDIVYTNLSAGKYVFHLSVLDSAGRNVSESHAYTLIKQPQFWEHAWFYAYLTFICIMGIVYVTWLIAIVHSNKIIEKQKSEIENAKKQAEMGNETILAIAKTVDAKDVNTSEHSERVSQYSVMIARKLGWTEEQCENLRKVALLHDIGKIGIPDSILNKPSRLSKEEFEIMKSHVVIGSKILKDFTIIENVQDGVKYHHERYDGTGYVEGLKAEEIPTDARIICIADAFDAMTSNRVYRERMDLNYVIGELKKGRGTQFDPTFVDIMLDLIKDGSIDVKHA